MGMTRLYRNTFNFWHHFKALLYFIPFFYFFQLSRMAGHHGQDGHHVMTTVFVPVKDFATIQGTCNRAVEIQMYTGWKRKRRSAPRRYVQVKITFIKFFKYNFQKGQLSDIEEKR